MNEATSDIGIVRTMMNVARQRPRKKRTTSTTITKVMMMVSWSESIVLTMKLEVSMR